MPLTNGFLRAVAGIFCGVIGLGQAQAGKPKDMLYVLPFPPENQTLESLSRSVVALYLDGGQLVAMPEAKGFAMVTPFFPEGETREKVFGALTLTKRMPVVPDSAPSPDWRGIDRIDDRMLFFDGLALAWIEAESKGMKEVLRRSIPWDMIRPPRDTRGEPTSVETRELRAQFKKAWDRVLGLKASGVAPIPAKWVGAFTKRTYVVALHVRGFTLATMECDTKDFTSCTLTRQCYLEKAPDLAPEAVAGIAVSSKRKMILIGDRKARMIHGFRFDSCYHVPRVRRWSLPEKIKDLNSVYIDAEERLWLSTKAPDDYLNASIYYWTQDQW